jgi:transcriptional regulator with XRE-family HTH domain
MVSNLVTQKAFADLIGVAKSYVTKLKQDGRLVMVDNKVDVEASKAMIEATKDENRDDVSKRWDGYRESDAQNEPEVDQKAAEAFGSSRAAKMYYDAQSAKLSFERESGKLVEVAEVKSIAALAGNALRQYLERLPDQLSPELSVESDERRIHAMLVERIEEALGQMATALAFNTEDSL